MLRRVFLKLLRIALVLAVVTIAMAWILRWVNPPTTAFILQHQFGEGTEPVRQVWVSWEAISPEIAIAAVAAEDQRFPEHAGFDLESIRSAIEVNQRRSLPRGASTISQQVAKNLFLWAGRSYVRKGLEAYFTVLIESAWPKRRILEMYLNIAEFGPGIYGVGAASEVYFGKPAAKVTPYEAALLAAVLPNPRRLHVGQPSGYVRERVQDIQQQVKQLGGPGYLAGL